MTESRAPYCNLSWSITVTGNPIPKGRPQFKNGHAYTPKHTREYESLVSQAAGIAWSGEPAMGDLSVTLRFYRANRIRCDIDNLIKSVADSLNGVIWDDDDQIVELHATKNYDKDRPRVEITVEPA